MKNLVVLIYNGSPDWGGSTHLSFYAETREDLEVLLRMAEINNYVAVVDFRGDDGNG